MIRQTAMKRLAWTAGVFALLLAPAAAIAHGTAVGAVDEDEAARSVLVRTAQAFQNADLHTLEELWSNDGDLTVIEGTHMNRGWPDYRDNHLVPEMKELKNVRYALTDVRLSRKGSVAWASFSYSLDGETEKRGPFQVEGLGTAVLRRQGRLWRIVHWHSSGKPRAK